MTNRDKFGRPASVCPNCNTQLDFHISGNNNGYLKSCPKCGKEFHESLATIDWEKALCRKNT